MAKNTAKPPESPEQIEKIVKDIEGDLTALIKSAREGMLSKVHPGEETPAEVPPDTSATAPAPAIDAGAGAGGPPPAEGAPPPMGADAGASPPDAGAPGAGDGGGEAEPSHEELVEAYGSLSDEQLAAHEAAIQEVKAQKMGGDAGAGAGGPPPEASPPPDAMKSEFVAALQKAEGALKTQGSKIAELTKTVTDLTAQLTKTESEAVEAGKAFEAYLRLPAERRAVTVSAPVKTDKPREDVAGLSKSEVSHRLRKAMRNPKVSDADRDLADQFVLGHVTVDKVQHLIVQAQ